MTKIEISRDLALPADAVTQTFGILAMKRMGKSYTARRLAEQFLRASLQTVIVDPKGDWWGIRSSADGKRPGFSIVIFGGEHGDVPLEPNGGEIVAKLIVEERVSALLDLSLLRKAQIATFMTAFLETLYRLKAREAYRTPVMLVIDEADIVAPQKPYHGEERMLGAAEDIVRRGGQRGIGCTMITQRAAVINKNVLTQVQVLVVLRTIGKKDRDALDEWIEVHGSPEERKELMGSIASLPKGDAWFWSPGWPTAEGIFLRTHVSPIETFDSGATPEAGKRPPAPKMLADVDLDAVRRQMADTVERAKADDPKTLRAEVARLRAELAKAAKASPPPAAKAEIKRVEVAVFKDGQLGKLDAAANRLTELIQKAGGVAADLQDMTDALVEALARIPESTAEGTEIYRVVAADRAAKAAAPAATPRAPARTTPRAESPVDGASGPSKPQQRIIDALAAFESLGQSKLARNNLAAFSNQTSTSSAYDRNLAALRAAGLITYLGGGYVALTDEGRDVAVRPSQPPTLEALHDAWRRQLSSSQVRMFDVLVTNYPRAVPRDELAELSQQQATSSAYDRNLALFRNLELAAYPEKGHVSATAMLFPVQR